MLLKTERQINIRDIYQVGGLIFYTEEDYLIFKNIDKNINQIVKSVKDGIIDLYGIFNIEKIRVIEFKYEAGKELYELFEKATDLLNYQEDSIEYKVGSRFYDMISLIKYTEFNE